MQRLTAAVLLALGVVLAALPPGLALAQSTTQPNDTEQTDADRSFPDTGYTIADDAIWTYFSLHGGAATFGHLDGLTVPAADHASPS